MKNLFANLPAAIPEELIEVLAENQHVRIERIVSAGHISPEGFWYDQAEHEWVVVLQGAALLTFPEGQSVQMQVGDHLLIPAHQKHRVDWTAPDQMTIWLAVFFGNHPREELGKKENDLLLKRSPS